MTEGTSNRKYILVDACVVASYYVTASGNRFKHLAGRAYALIEGVKSDALRTRRLLLPNICIPEVFGIFAKYRFGRWNTQVPNTINDLQYWRARLDFHNDIHNGRHIQQLELSRYHILATDLISPVDHHYEYYRGRGRRIRKTPMGAFDHTIIGMAISLVKSRGKERVLLVTADRRMGHILERAKTIKRKSAARLGLLKTAKDLGLEYGPDIYPDAVNLATASTPHLQEALGEWPLPVQKEGKAERRRLTRSQEDELIRLYRHVTEETSESLTYTDEFEITYEAFVARVGLDLSRNEVWRHLSNLRKRKKLPRKRLKS